MKLLESFRNIILSLVALCLVCALAAFLLPGLPGSILSGMTIALAGLIWVLCLWALLRLFLRRV
jgi:hypothetical protein